MRKAVRLCLLRQSFQPTAPSEVGRGICRVDEQPEAPQPEDDGCRRARQHEGRVGARGDRAPGVDALRGRGARPLIRSRPDTEARRFVVGAATSGMWSRRRLTHQLGLGPNGQSAFGSASMQVKTSRMRARRGAEFNVKARPPGSALLVWFNCISAAPWETKEGTGAGQCSTATT